MRMLARYLLSIDRETTDMVELSKPTVVPCSVVTNSRDCWYTSPEDKLLMEHWKFIARSMDISQSPHTLSAYTTTLRSFQMELIPNSSKRYKFLVTIVLNVQTLPSYISFFTLYWTQGFISKFKLKQSIFFEKPIFLFVWHLIWQPSYRWLFQQLHLLQSRSIQCGKD